LLAPGTLSAYMKQDKVPTLEKATEIAKALDVSVGWLCGEDEPSADIKNIHLSTYADIAKAINMLVSCYPSANGGFKVAVTKIDEYDQDHSAVVIKDGISIETTDPILTSFYSRYEMFNSFLNEQGADTELIEGWLYKKMAELEKLPLKPDSLPE